ncbi:MAG TPA: hypothetical protein VHU14_08080 [Solirubrobacterales bacterium]|jgi:hypothetical protein|nr:hypothetical protein [Solirubrobacterales bacterium]
MSAERVSRSGLERVPVVPLEAGAGPENPPCPACGEPLFGWIDARPGLAGPVSRCESCGLGVVGDSAGVEEALAALDGCRRGGAARIANRAGFAAWIGGAGWAGLEPGASYLFTVEAMRRLVANRDQVVARARWAPGPGVSAMWQTLLNSATFGHNLVVGKATRARHRWQRRIDWLTTAVLAIPAMIVALPLELIAAALRRGGTVSLRFELL